ncbi:adenosine receptor A3-like [Stylophora pistillata]|uniref:adenosine receptor A3-like n=1 Tax=Stylophora pistillata TaxID=50429 RepID=UPI000C043604|nr:adenosine receptor A3-like [Stylophora pistillata]XP_022781584.1 adenosine receptor A3-like [Stylophora pistillata]
MLEEDFSSVRTSSLIICILNAICFFPAALGNGIILIAIRRTPSLHSPSNTFLFGLALTDFLVGLVTQPLNVASSVIFLVEKEEGPIALTLAFDFISVVLTAASFMIATAISIDRYLVFYLHMRYQAIVTNKKVVAIVVLCWCLSCLFGVIWTQNTRAHYVIGIASVVISIVIVSLMYFKIYRVVRRHQAQIQSQARFGIAAKEVSSHLQFARLTKSAVNTFYVCFILFLCFFPYVFTAGLIQMTGPSLTKRIVLQYTGTIAFINSSLNPLVYFWRLPEIRKAIKRSLRCCYSRRAGERQESKWRSEKASNT